MYTIKINVFEFKKVKDKEDEKVLKETLYIEGGKLNFKTYYNESDECSKNTLVDMFARETFNKAATWIINPKDDPLRMLLIEYWNINDGYKNIIIFEYADVYILQNGKTIDKFVV